MGRTREFRFHPTSFFLIIVVLCGLLPNMATYGAIIREWWLGIGGRTVADLTSDPRYPDDPDGTELLDLFEGPKDWDNDYGSRLYGWLVAPESGEYTFWIASDDWSELWLSIDADPANTELIAYVNGGTGSREWTKFPSQKSKPITLQADCKYYVEAIMKERGNRDNIAVAWEPPHGILEVISGQHVDPYVVPPVHVSSPSPPNGAMSTEQNPVLGWLAGQNAEQHQVFFGEDEIAVTGADTSMDGIYCGQQAETTYSPGALEWGKTYFWRVDEVNDSHPESPWRGDVWRFSLPSGPPGYLLITNEKLASAFQVLVDWRTEDGLAGKLVTVENIRKVYSGRDLQEQIRNCIKDYYEHHGTAYVTLGGDDAIVPDRDCFFPTCSDMPTDLYYGGLDGTWDADGDGVYGEAGWDDVDLYPEVWVGRIPVRTTEQAAGYINKVVTYETASPDGFANTMLLAVGTHCVLRSGSERPESYQDHDPVSLDEPKAVGLYRGAIQPYWQATPLDKLIDTKSSWDTERCGDYDFTPEHLAERLNRGYNHVYIRTHGNIGFCGSENGQFYTTNAMELTNVDRPSIVYCEGCTTGAFDLGEPSLSEAFLRNPHGGAVAFIACSRVNSIGHVDAFYRELFVNKRRRIGEAFGYYKMSWAQHCDGYGQKRWIQFGRNLQGDSALRFLGAETARDLHLSSPHGCEIIEVDSDLTIRWNASGTDFELREKVKLEYSWDSGATWDVIPGAESLLYNGRIFIWRDCSLPAGSHYRAKVTSLVNPSISSMSAQDFTMGELCRLTVQAVPDANIVISGCYDGVTTHNMSSGYDITVPKGTSVSVDAPWNAEDVPELTFVRWKDEGGNTLIDMPDYTFDVTSDTTIVAEYGEPAVRHYYVNDETAENGIAPGDDRNDGRSPERPMRHIQALLDTYPKLGTSNVINVSVGVYEENISLSEDNTGLELVGAGEALTIIDGGQKGSCILLNGFAEGEISGIMIRNGSGSHGGGIWCANSSLRIQDCMFLDNDTTEEGGAMLIDATSLAEITQCTFARNSSGTGGAIVIYGDSNLSLGSTDIASCLFEGNTATYWGGAIHVQSFHNMTQIHDCTFIGNISFQQGGAIHLDRSVLPEVVRCTFRDNSSTWGGAIQNYGDTAQIKSCLFEANHADRDGGAVCSRNACTPTFTHCIFSSNDAGRYGGGITILADQSHATVTNCTFSGNSARNPGGALCAIGDFGATATNCIFWGSMPDQLDGGTVVSYSDVQGGWQGQGNIDTNPLFADLAGGDYHLKSWVGRWFAGTPSGWVTDNVTSPCIDTGDPASPLGDEPEPNGGRINMGAYGGTAEASKSSL